MNTILNSLFFCLFVSDTDLDCQAATAKCALDISLAWWSWWLFSACGRLSVFISFTGIPRDVSKGVFPKNFPD